MKKYKKIYNSIFFVFIIALCSYLLYKNYSKISSFDWNVNWVLLGISLVPLIIHFYILELGFDVILKSIGLTIPLKNIFEIASISNVIRYIPGGVWGHIGKTGYLKKKHGVSLSKSIFAVFLSLALYIASGILFFVVVAAFKSDLGDYRFITYLLFILSIIGLLAMHPKYLRILDALIKKFLRRNIELKMQDYEYQKIWIVLLYFWVSWMLVGISFAIAINAVFVDFGYTQLFYLSSIYAFSWVLGFLSFFAPNGIGVKEVVLYFFLSDFVKDKEVFMIVLVLFRFMIIIRDLIMWGIYNLKNLFYIKSNEA